MNIFKNFFISPSENEVIQTEIKVKSDIKPAVLGTICDENGSPCQDVFVAVYKMNSEKTSIESLETYTYTDKYGNFILAPLENGELYNVKIYKSNNQVRILDTTNL